MRNRRTKIRCQGLALAIASASCALAAPAASADSHRIPLNNAPFDIPATVCGFPIHVGVVHDNEYWVKSRSNPDGSTTMRVTGRLVLSFTNEQTGKTIVKNVSGPGTFTFYPNGSGTYDQQGNSIDIVGPAGQALGLPGLAFTTGHATGAFDSSFMTTTLSYSGRLIDGCTLLS